MIRRATSAAAPLLRAARGARAFGAAPAPPPPPPRPARIVFNHSTNAEGLIAALRAGAALAGARGVATFVPGRITRTRGGAAPRLALAVSVPTPGGWRVLARRGAALQELFVVTHLGAEALQAVLDELLDAAPR